MFDKKFNDLANIRKRIDRKTADDGVFEQPINLHLIGSFVESPKITLSIDEEMPEKF